MTALQPSDNGDAREMVAWAAAEQQSLEIIAGGSKRALGRPPGAMHRLDVSRLAGIVDYEPAELVLTARAATPMAEIEAELAARSQMLAFEPPDWRGLLGGGGEPTLGGVIACNIAGPRRVRAGSPRDYFLGFNAINGRGEAWKAGGKVVKNVTGYDMCKLQAGAYGTLSILTEVTLKTMPRPETACTLLLPATDDVTAIGIMAQALNTPHEVSAAAHLPAEMARRSTVTASVGRSGAVTALRLEGPAPSVAYRVNAVVALLGKGDRLEATETGLLWAEIGAVAPLLGEAGRYVWRLCPTPSAAATLVTAIRSRLTSAEAYYDWGGGLVWLSLDADDAGPDGGAAVVRAAIDQVNGHATLIVAPDPIRATVAVFQPSHGALAALSARIKQGFDPNGILNPGRIVEGQ